MNVADEIDGVQERVEDPEGEVVVSVMLAGFRLQDRPVEGEAVGVRLTVPAKPLVVETVMVDVPVVPEKTNTPDGLAATVKSWIV